MRTILCAALVLIPLLATAAERKVVTVPGARVVGPYSLGIWAGDYFYVSGQGARDSSGKLPEGIEAQTRQCMDNVKAILEAAGLTMGHTVYMHAYLSDMAGYDAFNKVYATYFSGVRPARAMIGVTRMPTDTPVEVTAIAVRDPATKKPVTLTSGAMPAPLTPAMAVGKRVYVSGILGRDADTNRIPSEPAKQIDLAFRRASTVLEAAGLKLRDMAYATVYVTPAIPADAARREAAKKLGKRGVFSIIETATLPMNANIEITGVAAKDFRRQGQCAVESDTYYCAARAGVTEEALKTVLGDLTAAGLTMSSVVSTNVLIDDIDNFAGMNKVYAASFPAPHPTRTTVQPTPKAQGKQNRFIVVAVK